MKKCLSCGQVSGIKKNHKFCHNCGGNVFEVTEKRIVAGAKQDERKAPNRNSRVDGGANQRSVSMKKLFKSIHIDLEKRIFELNGEKMEQVSGLALEFHDGKWHLHITEDLTCETVAELTPIEYGDGYVECEVRLIAGQTLAARAFRDKGLNAHMTNYDALIVMPKNSFANMIFNAVRTEFKTLQEFEMFLDRKLSEEGKEALQNLQHLTTD